MNQQQRQRRVSLILAIGSIALGLLLNKFTLERTISPDGAITTPLRNLQIASGQLTLIGFGLYLFLKRPAISLAIANTVINLGLSLVVAVVMLFLVEFGSRLFVPQWTPARADRTFWVYDDLLGWAHKPSHQGRFSHSDFSVAVSINSHGLRGKEYSINRVKGKKRLLVLGDSFGWGFGIEHNEIFTEILEDKYPDWETINASVSGYATDQQFLYYQYHGVQYQPDVVLLLFHPNDVESNNVSEEYWHNKPRFQLNNGRLVLTNYPVPKPTLRQRLDRLFLGRTYFLAQLYKAAWSLEIQMDSLTSPRDSDRNNNGVRSNNYDQEDCTITKNLLLSLNNFVQQKGAPLIVVSVPTADDNLKNFLRSTLQSEEIPYLPLDDAFSDTRERVIIQHDEHWNATGHKVVAAAIEKFLLERGVFP